MGVCEETRASQVTCVATETRLELSVDGELLFGGELAHAVAAAETIWSLAADDDGAAVLECTLFKAEPRTWDQVLRSPDPEAVGETRDAGDEAPMAAAAEGGASLGAAISSTAALASASASASPAVALAPRALVRVGSLQFALAYTGPYTDEAYAFMRDDHCRTDAYLAAIASGCVRDKVVVEIGTGALAILALACARAGARKVYAIEVDPRSAQKAREAVRLAGWEHVVRILEGASFDLSLPEPADVLVHELVGDIATSEGIGPALRDARRRLVVPQRDALWSIPAEVGTMARPVELSQAQLARWSDVSVAAASGDAALQGDGLSTAVVDAATLAAMPRGERVLRGRDFDNAQCLAPPQKCEHLRFVGDADFDELVLETAISFEVQRHAVLNGVLLYCALSCLPGAWEINAQQQDSNWDQLVCLFEPTPVQPGDVVFLALRSDTSTLQPRYTLQLAVQPKC